MRGEGRRVKHARRKKGKKKGPIQFDQSDLAQFDLASLIQDT